MSRQRPDTSLRRLRTRLWAWFAAVSVLAIVLFAAILVRVDTSGRRDRQDTELRGRADRAAALMYVADGRAMTDAVVDDSVSEGLPALVVFARNGTVLYRSRAASSVDSRDLRALARRSLGDGAEKGRRAAVGTLRAVALPWFDGRRVAGSVVALAPRVTYLGSDLFVPVVAGGVVLWLVLVSAGWLVTGRSVRPAIEAQRTREAFLATAAHELRTPLARLRAHAESGHQPTELVTMTDSATHMVNNLLLAASIDWGEPVVRRQVQRVDLLVADLEYQDPSVVVDVRQELLLDVDENLLRHALANVVANGLRHADPTEPLVLVTVRGHDTGVVITVVDNGAGFTTDYLMRTASAPVRFLSGSTGGTGLGLALVAWIAEAHDARLQIDNDTDGGGRVTLEFPRTKVGR